MRITSLQLILALLALAIPALAYADSREAPSLGEVKQAIQRAVRDRGKDAGGIEVRTVHGCYPVYASKTAELICLVDMNSPDGSFQTEQLVFRKGKSWEVLIDDESSDSRSPACPNKRLAEPLLRESLRDSQLIVAPSDESGTFSDERGLNRDKSGPLRLMCTYSVKGKLGEQTVVGYFQYLDGKYVLDPDREIWND